MDKQIKKGLIIGMLVSATAVTIYYYYQLKKIKEYYNDKTPDKNE